MQKLGVFLLVFSILGCGASIEGVAPNPEISYVVAPTGKVNLSWAANNENGVNTTGGGYKVYWSTSSDYSGATITDVPYASGLLAPTTVQLTGVTSGKYYLKIIGYTALNTSGSSIPYEKVVKVR